jgi:small subunit ribosomal protein S29
MQKKPGGGREIAPPKRGARLTLKKKKKGIDTKGRPVAPGERKAFRKRVVLSNTNAIEVLDMPELSSETMVDPSLCGQVIGIPGPVVDQLRASEAFKASQSWGFYRKPGMLLRQETVEMGQLLMRINEQSEPITVRKVFVGARASGKSTMLVQAMALAFTKQWVVINIPEGSTSVQTLV